MSCWGHVGPRLSVDITCHILTFANGATHAVMSSVNKSVRAVFETKPERTWSSPRLLVFQLLYGLRNRARHHKCDWTEAMRYVTERVSALSDQSAQSSALAEALGLQGLVEAETRNWRTFDGYLDAAGPLWCQAAVAGDWWSLVWLANSQGVAHKTWACRDDCLDELVFDRRTRAASAPACGKSVCLMNDLFQRAAGRHGCPVAHHWIMVICEQVTGRTDLFRDSRRRAIVHGNWATVDDVVNSPGARVCVGEREIHRRDRQMFGEDKVPRWRDLTKEQVAAYQSCAERHPDEIKADILQILGDSMGEDRLRTCGFLGRSSRRQAAHDKLVASMKLEAMIRIASMKLEVMIRIGEVGKA